MRLPVVFYTMACAVFVTGSLCIADDETEPQPTPEQIEFFENKIRPVLVNSCYECHSSRADELQAGLSVENRAELRRGGDSGPAVVPGKPDSGTLLSVLLYSEDDYQMPPEGKLPDHVIADFRRWIEMGAPDPRDGAAAERKTIDLAEGRTFWSFRPLHDAAPPTLADDAWSRTPIDRFLLHRMREAGLSPAPEADRRTLARRLHFDLVGLPPTPEQLTTFLQDDRPDAYERLVDRLLSSPEFGERWGRHWLDVVRFAESSGGGRTVLLPEAWRFRDYAVRSFNADKPYTRFVREHLAGDLLPADSVAERRDQLIGSGFLSLGPTNLELQDKELLRMEVVDEQIDTTGKAFLGMTIGCARCHDHKFDPIPTTDYYALAGIFRSTRTLTPGNVNGLHTHALPLPAAEERQHVEHAARMKSHADRIASLKKEVADLERQTRADPRHSAGEGVFIDDTEAVFVGRWSSGKLPSAIGSGYRYASPGTATATFPLPRGLTGQVRLRLGFSPHANRSSRTRVRIVHADGESEVIVNQRTPKRDHFSTLGRFRFDPSKRGSVIVLAKNADGLAIADGLEVTRLEVRPPLSAERPAVHDRRKRLGRLKLELSELEAESKRLAKATPKRPRVLAIADREETADYHLCIRGNVRNLGPLVPRGFLSVVDEQPPTIPTGESGRLELADWIANDRNPLTARVMGNRVWQHLFGVGLVPTPDNFGATGQPPTHPLLLDHLAGRFIEQEWSVKRLIREIVMSQGYRLSGTPSENAIALDPENRWLSWRKPRRLEAEAIRDAMLNLSGRLDPRRFGRTIPSGTRGEIGFRFNSTRRSIFLPVFRNTLLGLFEVFDFANPNIVQGRRNVSTLPTQALFLMNSPEMHADAEAAADRLLKHSPSDPGTRIHAAFERTLGRLPTDRELQLSKRFIETTLESHSERDAYALLMKSLFACLDFRYVR